MERQKSYYKANLYDGKKETKAEIRLFGLNPDHFRDVNGHSFRIKFDGELDMEIKNKF